MELQITIITYRRIAVNKAGRYWLVCVHRCPPLDGIRPAPICVICPILLQANGEWNSLPIWSQKIWIVSSLASMVCSIVAIVKILRGYGFIPVHPANHRCAQEPATLPCKLEQLALCNACRFNSITSRLNEWPGQDGANGVLATMTKKREVPVYISSS